jgi:demethylmenaquinone methyltransferase/2-methoxy-6-polyprenyl-1,4-benzoquinol methylase
MSDHRSEKTKQRDTLISKSENLVMFNQIAKRYDLMNRIISLGLDRSWRKAAVKLLLRQDMDLVLDIGCGTADLALDIAKVSSVSRIIGIDPSFNMLKEGHRKMDAAFLRDRISLTVGDATILPFGSEVFDGIVLGFVIRNVEQRRLALLEMVRVLRPGGRLVILELGIPKNAFFSFCHRIHTRTLVPLAAAAFADKGAYGYLIHSVEAFPSPEFFVEEMRTAGFQDAAFLPLTLGAVNVFYGNKGFK